MPAAFQLDEYAGQAWLGVVPFRMTDIRPRATPALPYFSRTLELNVRTYVTVNGKPGVYFFSLDAERPLAVRIARQPARAEIALNTMTEPLGIDCEGRAPIVYFARQLDVRIWGVAKC
jgi:uncharacterized protein YqjF (DUF2071 family)